MTAEKEYLINFAKQHKKLCLSLHYNGTNSYVFVNGIEIHKFKAKNSEINSASLYLENVSKNFAVDSMTKIGVYGYVY